MTFAERKILNDMRELAEKRPETRQPSVAFIRDWAYGNAGIEDEKITREQVETVIPEEEKK